MVRIALSVVLLVLGVILRADEAFDFQDAWKRWHKALSGEQPRTATNVLAEIEREAIAAKRWPFAVKASALRIQQEQNVDDSFTTDWIPACVARIESAPEEMRPYLDLYLARLYVDNSRPWRWGGRSPTKLTEDAAESELPAWSPERLPASLEALFARVLAASDRLKAEPVGDWNEVILPSQMPDSCRPTLYDLAVHDIIGFYGKTVPDKTLEKGLALLDGLIAFHQNDTNLDARADAELARLQYRHAFAELPQKEKDAQYAEALDAFIDTYFGKSEVGTIALERRARMMWQAGDGVKARELALKGAARMPVEKCGAFACTALVAQIEAPYVSFETERVWSEPYAPITVSTRNTDKVFFKLARLSYEDFVDNDWNSRDRIRDAANAAKPVRTWSVGLPHYDDYAEHVESAEVPSGLAPGYYCLFAGLDDQFNATKGPFYAEKVMVSDIALVTACGDGCYAGTVFTSKDGARVAGAKVELWGSKEWDGPQELLATDWTGPGGDFSIKDQRWRQCRLRVFAGGSEAVVSDGSLWPGCACTHRMNPNRTAVVTDRAIYRPGQTIRFKGYAAHVDPYGRCFWVLPDSQVTVELFDPHGQCVATLSLTANEWGSFVGEFTAPRDRLTGCYRIRSRVDCGTSSGTDVFVEEYKRPKFSAELGRAPADAALGREVELVGKATAYSGIPVDGAKVKWSVARTTRYPRWWRWFGRADAGRQIAQGETVTDADGAFRLRFTPVADPAAELSGEPSFLFEIKADVTDTTGETRSVETLCEIGTVAWRAEVTATDGAATDERVAASVSLASLDGTVTSARGTLSVYRLKGPASPVRKPLDDYPTANPCEWDWRRWPNGEAVKTMSVEVTDGAWKGSLDSLPAGAYRMVFETKDPAGKAVTGRAEFAVIDYASEKLGFAAPDYFVLRPAGGEAKVGTKLAIVWASGYAGGYGRVEVFSNGERVLCKDTPFEQPFVREEYEVRKSDRGTLRVRTTFFREGRLYVNEKSVSVPWDDKELSIVPMHLTSKLETGAKETWSFKVSGESEVLAFMYDRSLDAFLKHDAAFPFRDFSIPDVPRPYPVLANVRHGLAFAGGMTPLSFGQVLTDGRSFESLFSPVMILTMTDGEGKETVGFLSSGVKMRSMLGSRTPGFIGAACRGGAAAPRHVEPTVEVRRRLDETAFFQPQLVTDEEGRFSVTFTAPEAISGWRFVAIAHDRRLRSGVYTDDSITTTRPLTVEPNAPRFVREGDDFEFAVKVTNNSDGPEAATVSLEFEDLATLTPAKVGGGVKKVELKPHEARSVMFKVRIPDGQDFLKYTAKAVGAKFADGEEGTLAVLSRRIEVREAVQLNVRGKATKTFALTNLLESVKNGDTIRSVDLSVRVVSRPAWYAVASLPYLMEFPHECCEQTFSRHYANRLAEYIANADPRIRAMFEKWRCAGADALKSPLELNENLKAVALEATPWLREAGGETAARKRMGLLFDRERVESESRLALEKLRESLTGSVLLPWFPGGPSSPHVSLYAAIGFARLERLAKVRRPDWSWRLVAALDAYEKDDVARRLDWCRKNNAEFRMSDFDVRWLYLQSFLGGPAGDAETTKLLKSHLEKDWPGFSVADKAFAAVVLHRGGSAALARDILKSLKESAVVSEEFGMYYKRDAFFSSGVFSAPVSTQTAVVEAFKEIADDQETVDALNVWILKQKETQAWRTTASTADAIYALLIGSGTDLLAGDALATVTLGGVEVPKKGAEAGTGAYAASWRGADVKPEMGAITLTGVQEKGVVWGGVNWTYLEDVDKVRSFEPQELRIEKRYFRKIRTPEGARLEPVKGVLEQGDELVARLKIRADRTFEFVHVQDERPSTAEPVDVISKYRWQDGVGYYQSTRDTATHYYIDRLNKGTFVLETSYRVQQRGVFSGGLARIQCMYAPEFTAHSTSERVEVHGGVSAE